ncbi:hypothetical protein TNCT_568631 [Trichonephila clavata]|uniref:Uncharacterized protein n=1 Tax=Trichonephila clavata TaxID=2740835 RepID=A0A8X6INN4_TRICU|nr:hypothetical protein TNCT_568631 [Trichonephila clavata]
MANPDIVRVKGTSFWYKENALRGHVWLCSRVGLSITPIPREGFDVVEKEQQSKNALTALTACSESKDDAVFTKKASLNATVEVPFVRYEDTPPNNCVSCVQKIAKTAYFAVNTSS